MRKNLVALIAVATVVAAGTIVTSLVVAAPGRPPVLAAPAKPLVLAERADARTLSIATAQAVTKGVAYEQFRLSGWAQSWGVGSCRQVISSAVDCDFWLRRNAGVMGGCTWNDTLHVYYASPAEREPSNTFGGPATCNPD